MKFRGKNVLHSDETMNKIARVERLIRMEVPIYLACKTVGISTNWYRKVKEFKKHEEEKNAAFGEDQKSG